MKTLDRLWAAADPKILDFTLICSVLSAMGVSSRVKICEAFYTKNSKILFNQNVPSPI